MTDFLDYSHINISKNGSFFVVDLKNGISQIYRVFYESDVPSSIVFQKDFISMPFCISSINGYELICATSANNKVIICDIFSGKFLFELCFNDIIRNLAFDEIYGLNDEDEE